MTRKKDEILIEDLWAKIFALHIGCSCPNDRVKEKFIHYVLANRVGDIRLTEDFVFSQFPTFINYLAEY
jgi:hypothetical protein